jgi:hypothetical protein
MYTRYTSAVTVGLAALSLWLAMIGSASAATISQPANTFLAIYGKPNINAKEPVGGGLARNFGFGENMLFEASTALKIGLNILLTHEEKKLLSEDAYVGATLQSNLTGENNPLALAIQFVDLQDTTFGGVTGAHYADTYDRPWIMTICAPKAEKCRVDPRFTVGTGPDVKIEDVSIDANGLVLQGTIWGTWVNGKAGAAPCIKLENPPASAAADQTLFDTQGGTVGLAIAGIDGEMCLISANNDWFRIGSAFNEPAITIENR